MKDRASKQQFQLFVQPCLVRAEALPPHWKLVSLASKINDVNDFRERIRQQIMRIMARIPGVLNGIVRCAQCNGPMVKVGAEYKCPEKVDPEELVAVGFIPVKDASGNKTFTFDLIAKDQQQIQASQAYSKAVEIDDVYLQSLGLDLEKIRQYQLKHGLVP